MFFHPEIETEDSVKSEQSLVVELSTQTEVGRGRKIFTHQTQLIRQSHRGSCHVHKWDFSQHKTAIFSQRESN